MKICNQCETINADSAQFCSKCGSRLGASQHGVYNRGRYQPQQPTSPQYQQPQCQQPQPQQPQYQQPQPQQNRQSQWQSNYNQNQLPNFGFGDAIRVCLQEKYASFEGRAKRSEYWYFVLFSGLICIAAAIVGGILGALFSGGDMGVTIGLFCVIYAIIGLGLICPSISVLVRRLHDTGRSGWWYWISLLPYIGGIILFIFCCLGSQESDNEYGPYVRYS